MTPKTDAKPTQPPAPHQTAQAPPSSPFAAATPPKPPPAKDKPSSQRDGMDGPVVRFDLPRGNIIEIRLRSKVTRHEFQKIKKIFELSEFAFVEEESDPDRPPGEEAD